jgi:hypothetical protein
VSSSRLRTSTAGAFLAFGGALSGCASIAEPRAVTLPPGAIEVAAPAIYREWSDRTEACSGLTGQFSSVKWYVVPGVETFETDEGPKVGMWTSHGDTDRIIIAGVYRNTEMVVRHEILHHLLGQAGHPPEYFVTRCHLTWDSWDSAQGTFISGPGE